MFNASISQTVHLIESAYVHWKQKKMPRTKSCWDEFFLFGVLSLDIIAIEWFTMCVAFLFDMFCCCARQWQKKEIIFFKCTYTASMRQWNGSIPIALDITKKNLFCGYPKKLKIKMLETVKDTSIQYIHIKYYYKVIWPICIGKDPLKC